jgi:hypothetical protein
MAGQRISRPTCKRWWEDDQLTVESSGLWGDDKRAGDDSQERTVIEE